MTDNYSDNNGRPGHTLRCALLILALLLVSVAMGSQMGCAMGQVQSTMQSEPEQKAPQHSMCYGVQVGAYEKRADAVAMMIKLAETFRYPMMLTQVALRDDVRWRLRVQATSKDEAHTISERLLAEQGVQAWIVPMLCTNSVKE